MIFSDPGFAGLFLVSPSLDFLGGTQSISQNKDLGEGFSGEERCLLGDMATEFLCFTEVEIRIFSAVGYGGEG